MNVLKEMADRVKGQVILLISNDAIIYKSESEYEDVGYSKTQIGRMLDIDRKTVRKVLIDICETLNNINLNVQY